MTVTITVSNEEALEEMMKMKQKIKAANDEMQREFIDPKNRMKIDKITATFEEVKK